MTPSQIQSMLEMLGVVVAAIASACAIALPALKRLRQVLYELRPNGGGSLRDAIDRVEQKQQDLVATVTDVRTELHEHIDEKELTVTSMLGRIERLESPRVSRRSRRRR